MSGRDERETPDLGRRRLLIGSTAAGTGNGQIRRFQPSDFLTKSHNEKRYGKKAVTDYDLKVQDRAVHLTANSGDRNDSEN